MGMRAPIRGRWQVTLPREVREALRLQPGDDVEFEIGEDGVVRIRGMRGVPTDQLWYWTTEWQSGEREADADITAGRGTYHDSDEDFLASLRPS